MDLFDIASPGTSPSDSAPLAERVRPTTLDGFVGQEHLLGAGRSLRVLIESDAVPSLIFWGPPGSGKTTLARIIAAYANAEFHQLNAVSSGVKDVREVLDRAAAGRRHRQARTILFIDEIHRFNKAQQDALLHSVEEGLITLIGATTENPSFEVISPLLSRCRVFILEPLSTDDLTRILEQAIAHDARMRDVMIVQEDREMLLHLSGGDARSLLNALDVAVRLTPPGPDAKRVITRNRIEEAFQRRMPKYDKGGEEHYNIISAFIKSMRGSDPDAAVYWLARMLEGGEDPKFIARRMIVLASEDIGNADPYALTLATSCFTAVDYVGLPEARIILAQAAAYLASCPKSNASYVAIEEALGDVRSRGAEPVPLHLRNAPTSFMKGIGYGRDYRYAHDYDANFTEQEYLPDSLKERVYYRPTTNGAEEKIRASLLEKWKTKKR